MEQSALTAAMPLENTFAPNSAFEGGEIRFQAVARRVRNAGVFVSLVFAQFLLKISGCRINGRSDRASFRVGFLPDVNGASGEAGSLYFCIHFDHEIT